MVGLLTRQVAEGREVLRQLLVEPVQFTPFEEDGHRGYPFAGEAVLTGLLAGVLEVTRVASPPPASWNQIIAWLKQIEAVPDAA